LKLLALMVWLGEDLDLTARLASPPGAMQTTVVQSATRDAVPFAPEAQEAPAWASSSLPTGSDAVRLLWPDLQTLPPSDFEIRNLSRGRRILRLANTVWNSGQGRLELAGETNPRTQRTEVQQRLYAADGAVYAHRVGEFIWHPTHDHWHMEDFALYQLWSLGPQGELERVVSNGAKLSYCLIDTDVVKSGHPDFDARRRYRGCGRTLQGLSIGWGDKYDSFLDGQSLDITDLADGIYGLVSTANPDARLLEADYTNNAVIVYLKIVGKQVGVVPSPELDPKHCLPEGWC
jgi:hypothetical protein